jgi:hypothetical protein
MNWRTVKLHNVKPQFHNVKPQFHNVKPPQFHNVKVRRSLTKEKKQTLMVQTQHWLEDSVKGNCEQVGVGIYTPQSMLDTVLDPKIIMKGVWKELVPRINKLLEFNEPLQFGDNEDGQRAFCAPWNRENAKSAFRGPGFYLSTTCLHWLDVAEQPGEFSSWRGCILCATQFWPKPNPHPPHLTGWVKDASIFESTVMPKSIKLRGSFELLAGLGLQLHKCSDEGLLAWKQMMRSMVITVYEDGPNSPLKGLAIKQATELGTLEQSQSVTPLGQAMMMFDMLSEIPGAIGPVRIAYDKMAAWFSKQSWAPKEWGNTRFVCSAIKVHEMFVKPPATYKILKKMHLMFGKAGLNDSLSKLEAAARSLDNNPESILIFIKTMLYCLKRSEWIAIPGCTCTNMTGRPDRGVISTPVVCLLMHHLAEWAVTHFEISQVVSSKMKDIADFDMNFSCPKDSEQRGEPADRTWQHNVREGTDTVAIDFLRDLHTGKLVPCLSEAYKRSPNWKDACKNPLPWLESLRGEPKYQSKILEYLDNLTNLQKTNKSFLAETVHLQPVPGPSCPGDTQSQELAEDSQVSQNSGRHSSPEDTARQEQEDECQAVMMQHLATTVRFVEASTSLNSNAVGALLCGNSTIEEFRGGYKCGLSRAFVFDCVAIPEARSRPWRQVPTAAQDVKDRLSGIVTYLKAGDFLIFFDGGVKENLFMCHDVSMTAIRSGKKVTWTDFSLVYKIEESSAWSRRRGFGCAANVETMVVVTVDYHLSKMQKKEQSVGDSTWYSNAVVGLSRCHPAKAPQMEVEDKDRLYKEAFGRSPDCRPKSSDPLVTKKLNLGSIKGCCPLVWQPRSIPLACCILNDFNFKMVVDCYAGDGAWARANLQSSHPRPYVGMTMCKLHSKFLTLIASGAIKEAMATEGHEFCDTESLAMIEAVFPDIITRVQNQEEDEFPQDEDGEDSSPSDAEETVGQLAIRNQ